MVIVYATGGSQPQLDMICICSLPLQQTWEDSIQCWHAYGTLTSERSGPQYMCMLVIAVHATGGVLKRSWGCSYNNYRPVAYTFRELEKTQYTASSLLDFAGCGLLHTCSCTIIPYCLALLAVTPPPPIFGRNYFTSITRPPPRGPLEPVCRTAVLHVYACCKCRRVVFVYQACRK